MASTMRLLNTKTLKFKETYDIGSGDMRYAILSHRWGDEEVSFEDFVLAQQVDDYPEWWPPSAQGRLVKQKAGYNKITKFCSVVKDSYGLKWCWVDTCCIDKRSSAELSEAINSMWSWYQTSKVCLVYMPDVTSPPDPVAPEDDAAWSTFRGSAWFTRCWTLQELLAPYVLSFCTRDWVVFGEMHKTRHMAYTLVADDSVPSNRLVLETSRATRIPQSLFCGRSLHIGRPTKSSIAERMSWAAGRKATRSEDVAYSLFGLFNINMPLLYGEGDNAFLRLQHEILRQTHDLSIFAWNEKTSADCHCDPYTLDSPVSPHMSSKVLASSPDRFAGPGGFCNCWDSFSMLPRAGANTVPYIINNLGIDITMDCEIIFRPDTLIPITLLCIIPGPCWIGTCGRQQRIVAMMPFVGRHAPDSEAQALKEILETPEKPQEVRCRVFTCRSGNQLRSMCPPDASRGVRRLRLLLPLRPPDRWNLDAW